MHSIAFSKCIFPGIFVAVLCSPSSNFNLKEKHQLSTRYFSLNFIFTYQVDFHLVWRKSLRCFYNSLNDTLGLLSLNSLFFLWSLNFLIPDFWSWGSSLFTSCHLHFKTSLYLVKKNFETFHFNFTSLRCSHNSSNNTFGQPSFPDFPAF